MGKIQGLTDKPVKTISPSTLYYRARRGESVDRKDVEAHFGAIIFLKSYKELLKEVDNFKSPLKPKDVLYFDSSSKFPRFKLQDSGFKRCIKENKANAVVFGQNIYKDIKFKSTSETATYTFYEEKDNYFVICNDDDYYTQNILSVFKENTMEDLVVNKYLEKGATKIYEGPIINVNLDISIIYDKIFNHTYPNIIFDKELDTVISSNLEELTDESLNSIKEMLESEDMAVVDMGLKLLPNYNIADRKLSIGTVLAMCHQKCNRSNVWNSTSVKQLKESINFREPSSPGIPGCFYQLINEDETYSEDDVTMAKRIMLSAVSEQIDAATSRLNKTASYYNLDININAQ